MQNTLTNMRIEETIKRILREELSSHNGNESRRHKVFYGFQGLPNFWSNDYDRVINDSYFDDKNYKDYYFDNFYDMDKEFGHEKSLFGTKGLPVGHPNRSSKSFDMYNDKYGPAIVRVVDEREGIYESILMEETEGIDSFFNEISEVHVMSDELKQFLKKFIEESNCKRISFSKFKIFVLGLALDSGVLINSMALTRPLPFLLFLIFHEIAHQYQFKKYGVDIMYDCYLGEVSEMDAAKFMKHTEEVADDFAYRKIRELEKLKLIEPYTPPQMYKTLPIQNIVSMINNYKNDMRGKNIDSPKKISEYFYNMVKGEL